eukprot:TRINITY_DN143_c0_g1_i5.p1 TRINITY_DN143_c0_g1~~TRINITY_DN143_c0_g1_i5.p1  ORF type:complete len:162 (-),score=42.55 TRINITY_DN143_c0_g1_i5:188-628(-)
MIAETISNPSPFVELCYYAAKMPNPLSNRDWVMKYFWTPFRQAESCMFNYSITHPSYPKKKNFVRATTLIAGYYIQQSGSGCTLTYVAHNDWNGNIPAFLINQAAKMIAPSIIDTLHKACQDYPTWKATHDPSAKPWRHGISGKPQ